MSLVTKLPPSPGRRCGNITRSRNGCTECRKRRRKCDEQKPTCGLCSIYHRGCWYAVELNWGGREFKKSRFGQCLDVNRGEAAHKIYTNGNDFVYGRRVSVYPLTLPFDPTPRHLLNGQPIPHRYRRLLDYFIKDVLASISCDTPIHQTLRGTLVPSMLDLPHVFSAALTVAVAGLSARGLTHLDGTSVDVVGEHLRTSSLSQLRIALEKRYNDEFMLAASLLLCLADLYAGREGMDSWRVHLRGAEAFVTSLGDESALVASSSQLPVGYLCSLYSSIGTLANVVCTDHMAVLSPVQIFGTRLDEKGGLIHAVDLERFLGYNLEVLEILQHIDLISRARRDTDIKTELEPDAVRQRLEHLIAQDSSACPSLSTPSYASRDVLPSPISRAAESHDLQVCRRMFQQATLIQLYRRLYDLPSISTVIQSAVESIIQLIMSMTQGQYYSTWVVILMPLFTAGCEAVFRRQKVFILDQMQRLQFCLGSLHVDHARKALEQVWNVRAEKGDASGKLSAIDILRDRGTSLVLF